MQPDRVLTQLPTLLDMAAMRAVLSAHLPSCREGATTVERCTIEYLRYKPESKAVALYSVVLVGEQGPFTVSLTASIRKGGRAAALLEHPDMVALAEAAAPFVPNLPPAAWIEPLDMLIEVLPFDSSLPGLVPASDPGRALLGVVPDPGEWKATLIHYKPERKAVFRYDPPPSIVSGAIYGKVHRRPLRGPMMTANMVIVEDAGLPGAHVLAYFAEPHLLLQTEVPGPTARKILSEGTPEEASVFAGEIAQALAGLQQCGPMIGPVKERAQFIKDGEATVRLLQVLLPEVADVAAELLGRLKSAALDLPKLPLQYAHGDFNHSQIVKGPAGATILDLEAICRAEPSMDVGNFISHLRRIYTEAGERPQGLEAAEDAFIETYLRVQPHVSRRHLEWSIALASLKSSFAAFRRQDADWPRKIARRIEQARMCWPANMDQVAVGTGVEILHAGR